MRRLLAILLLLCAGCATPDIDNSNAQAVRNTSEYRRAMAEYRIERPSCEWCGRQPIEVHHVVPVQVDRGRACSKSNMVSLCRDCHLVLGHAHNWSSRYFPRLRDMLNKYQWAEVSP